MTTSKTAKLTKKLDHAESVVIGMGFLIQKLKYTYGSDFGEGMTEQVNQAIKDYQTISKRRANEAKQAEETK